MMVSVLMLTYNHQEFIAQAIEGVLSQKTTFDIELIIANDYSTDNTDSIIKKIIEKDNNAKEKIKYINNSKNIGMQPNFILAYNHCKGKYIAECEGDDYWTDPLKLQKQVDFLEANPDYGMVHTELDLFWVKNGKRVRNHHKMQGNVPILSGDIYETLLLSSKNLIFLCTVMIRVSALKGIDLARFSQYHMGDGPLWIHIASQSKIGFLPESMAVQRYLPFSLTQGRDFAHTLKFHETGLMVCRDYAKIRPISEETMHKIEQKFHIMFFDLCFNKRPEGNRYLIEYNSIDPSNRSITIKLKYILLKARVSPRLARPLAKILRKLSKDG